MGDDRAFKNPFPDLDDDADFLDEKGKLKGDHRAKVLASLQTLLPEWEKGIGSVDHYDNSVYTGTSGLCIVYSLLYKRLEENKSHASNAESLLTSALKHIKGKKASFLCGDAGPLAISAVIFHEMGREKQSKDSLDRLLKLENSVLNESDIPDEILFGRAGYLYALIYVQGRLKLNLKENMTRVVEKIIESGQALSEALRNSGTFGSFCPPLMYMWHESYYLGAAHGLAGIYFMLLRSGVLDEHPKWRFLVQSSIDDLLTLALPSGNFPSSLKSKDSDKLIHWCHGAPGFIHLLLEAFKVFEEEKYLAAAEKCGEVIWSRGLLKKGYGICHGVAGNAYAFLALFQVTKEDKHLHRALKFAEWINDYGKHGCRRADRPFSLFEGLGGTVYFLAELLDPMKARFPCYY